MKTPINNVVRLPVGRRILFEETTKYKVGGTFAIVKRTFAPVGSESMSEILKKVVIADISENAT